VGVDHALPDISFCVALACGVEVGERRPAGLALLFLRAERRFGTRLIYFDDTVATFSEKRGHVRDFKDGPEICLVVENWYFCSSY